MRVNWRPSLSSSIVNQSGCLICCCHANRRILPTFFALPSCNHISWRYAWIRLWHIWMVGLKSLSGCKIFIHFFLACTLISVICLYSLLIIVRSQLGKGYLQYCVILSTASNCSTMWWILNCSWTILLYLLTNDSWDVPTYRPAYFMSEFTKERASRNIKAKPSMVTRTFRKCQHA